MSPSGIDPTHPEDVGPQPDLGQPAAPRRIGQTGAGGFDGNHSQVSPQIQTPTFTKLANLPPEPCKWHCCDGLLRCAHSDFSSSLRVGRHEPRAAQSGSFQHDGFAYGSVEELLHRFGRHRSRLQNRYWRSVQTVRYVLGRAGCRKCAGPSIHSEQPQAG